MGIKVIITGATGMVGEGVLLTCLEHSGVSQVLMVNRKHFELQHDKLKELIVPDFLQVDKFAEQLKGYDACFFCAGISSVGMAEEKYTHITYDTTIHFAKVLAGLDKNIVFTYVSGSHTDSTEKGSLMWARVKGRTENALKTIGFKAVYNFRPGAMKHYPGQKHSKMLYTAAVAVINLFAPKKICSLKEVGTAMINSVTKGYHTSTVEIEDIHELARG